MCIIRWFTAVPNLVNANRQQANPEPPATPDEVPALLTSAPARRGIFLRNRKTCPLCRASITERPAEIWSIKAMVSNLAKSKLAELPSAPPSSIDTSTANADPAVVAGNDAWLNVFPRPRHLRNQRHQEHQEQNRFYPAPPEDNQEREQEGWGLEEMGMYDPEDGGIYRCIDCMHEIWGGVCTSCQREYPGHERFEDDSDDDGDFHDVDDDEDDAHGGLGGNFLGRRLREIWRGYNEPALGWGLDEDEDEDDDDDVDMGEFYDAHGDPVELTDDDDESDSDEDSDLAVGVIGHTEDEDEDDDHSGHEWYTDDDGESDDDHHHNGRMNLGHLPNWPAVDMLQGLPLYPVPRHHLRRQLGIEPAPAGHIEEVDDGQEDEHNEHHEDEGESDSDQHSHPDSEVDYEDGFVVDDDDEPYDRDFGDPGHDDEDEDEDHHVHRRRRTRRREFYDDPEEDDHDDGIDPRLIARQLGRGMRLGGGGPADAPPLPSARSTCAHSGRRQSRLIVVDDNDTDDEENHAGPSTRPQSSRRQRRIIVDEDDSDDSDHFHVDGELNPERDDDDDEVEVTEIRAAGRRAGGLSSARARRATRRAYDDDSE